MLLEPQKLNEEIIAKFKKKKTHQTIISISMAVFFIGVLLIGDNLAGFFGVFSGLLSGVLFAIFVAIAVFSWLDWRCPACDGALGKERNPKFCQHCGTQLRR